MTETIEASLDRLAIAMNTLSQLLMDPGNDEGHSKALIQMQAHLEALSASLISCLHSDSTDESELLIKLEKSATECIASL